jgi:O-antigen ligase
MWATGQSWYVALVSILFILAILSVFNAPVQSIAILKTIKLGLFILFSISFGFVINRSYPNWTNWIKIWLIPFVPLTVMSIYEITQGHSLGIWLLGNWRFSELSLGVAKIELWGIEILRPYATFPHPNVLGGVSAIFLALALFAYHENKNNKGWLMMGIGMVWLLVILSFSRSAWIGLGLGFVVVFLYQKVRQQQIQHYSQMAKVFLMVSVVFVVPYTIQLFSVNEQSVSERIYLLEKSMEILKDAPVFGIGSGNFLPALLNLPTESSPRIIQPVHNTLILIAVENGVLAAFIVFLVWVNQILRLFSKSLTSKTTMMLMCLSIVFIVWMFDHYLWSISIGQSLLWFVMGLGLAVLQSDENG